MIRELPIRQGLQGPTVPHLHNSSCQRIDSLALQLETGAENALDCSPGSAYRADGMLENTGIRPQSSGVFSIYQSKSYPSGFFSLTGHSSFV